MHTFKMAFSLTGDGQFALKAGSTAF
jgi:hypothetical protein